MLYNENIKGEGLGQEKLSNFGTLQFYTRFFLKTNSDGTLSASENYSPRPGPPAYNNPTVVSQQEAEEEETNLAQKAPILRPPQLEL